MFAHLDQFDPMRFVEAWERLLSTSPYATWMHLLLLLAFIGVLVTRFIVTPILKAKNPPIVVKGPDE